MKQGPDVTILGQYNFPFIICMSFPHFKTPPPPPPSLFLIHDSSRSNGDDGCGNDARLYIYLGQVWRFGGILLNNWQVGMKN